MSKLAPDLFDRRFDDLMELGRARLRGLAPGWTDHNIHDPGITLMELMAWTAEAQLYALSRIRKDERRSFAALLGISAHGAQPSTGILWSDRNDPNCPSLVYSRNILIEKGRNASIEGLSGPFFQTTDQHLFLPGSITGLSTRRSGKQILDHTRIHSLGNIPFLPFGPESDSVDKFIIGFRCRDENGFPDSENPNWANTRWAIGILAASPLNVADSTKSSTAIPFPLPDKVRPKLSISILSEGVRYPVIIQSDTSWGMMQTGIISLDVGTMNLPSGTREFEIEIQCPKGFPRPPRILRFDPHAIPIEQSREINGEPHIANGQPNWSFQLEESRGLVYDTKTPPVKIEVAEIDGLKTWTPCADIEEFGPHDRVFQFDIETSTVQFGNGINGQIPCSDSYVLATYKISDGLQGNIGRNRSWTLRGLCGVYGKNLEPMVGGQSTSELSDLRRHARVVSKSSRPLVTDEDIVEAALHLPLLEVAKAWIAKPSEKMPRSGLLTLVAVRSRYDAPSLSSLQNDYAWSQEPPRWLAAIAASLAPRLPLGTRLQVVAPNYVRLGIDCIIEVENKVDPDVVRSKVREELIAYTSITSSLFNTSGLQQGARPSQFDVNLVLRRVNGIHRIESLELKFFSSSLKESRNAEPEQTLSHNDLLIWDESLSFIDVRRRKPQRTS